MKEFLDFCEKSQKQDICELSDCETSEYYGTSPLPQNVVTTMAYVPFQTDTTMYDYEKALRYGTAFVNLNKPFLGGECI